MRSDDHAGETPPQNAAESKVAAVAHVHAQPTNDHGAAACSKSETLAVNAMSLACGADAAR
jgi:hypothetical protein